MPAVVIVAVLALLGVAALGTLIAWHIAPTSPVGRYRRVHTTVEHASGHVGRVPVAVVVLLAGFSAAVLSHWALGKVAHSLEGRVDRPVFDWFDQRLQDGGWRTAWEHLTQIGNRPETQLTVLVFAVVLPLAWRLTQRSRWWVPLVILPAGYLFEKLGQMLIKSIVDRGHPPTTNGTWVSGGCARLTIVAGLVIFLALHGVVRSRRVWAMAWTLLAVLVIAEAYSRTYLLKHWFTDVVGGITYGVAGLLTMIAVALVLDRAPRRGVPIQQAVVTDQTIQPGRYPSRSASLSS